jgi:hypothetical protein
MLGVGPILNPLYLENSKRFSKSVRRVYKENY